MSSKMKTILILFFTLILWILGFYLIYKGCGLFGCFGILLLLYANNIEQDKRNQSIFKKN